MLNEHDIRDMKSEKDPNGKQPHEPGAKLDAGKSPVFRGLLDYFPNACRAVADVSQFGAKKYAWKGWETVPEGVLRYTDAMVRHCVDSVLEGSLDKTSGLTHAAHMAWNALAVLELTLRQQPKEVDADDYMWKERMKVEQKPISIYATGGTPPRPSHIDWSALVEVGKDWVSKAEFDYKLERERNK
jgi:hypothetical protein